jgi:hypothetical protein
MSIITYTRPAKCKDCNHLKYFYKGKRKLHFCIKRKKNRCLNDPAGYCIDQKWFDMNVSTIPKRLEYEQTNP